MATISTIDQILTETIAGGTRGVEIHSDAALKADTVSIDETASGWALAIRGWRNAFIGVHMFDVNGALIVDSAGSFAITILTRNTRQFEAPPQPTIDATAPLTHDFTASTYGVKVVPTALSDTVTWRLVLTFLLL